MYIDKDELLKAFNEVKYLCEAIEQYYPAPTTKPYSLDEIEVGVKELTGKTIEKRIMPFEADNRLRGLCKIYADRAEIYLDADQNPNWTRYVAMKEYSHVVLCDADNVTVNPSDTIEYMVLDEKRMLLNGEEPPADAVCEMLAKIVAIETLFPFEERKAIIERHENGSAFDVFLVSRDFGIPKHVVEFALSDWYMELAAEMVKKLNI